MSIKEKNDVNKITKYNIVTSVKLTSRDNVFEKNLSKNFEQTLKILANKEIGPLDWIEFRDLKNGGNAFKQIHEGTCVSPKIILLP